MDNQERQSAILAALTTEHFVLQTATSATINESTARASIYITAVSTSVVAMGFASQSRDAFGPFVASVLPAIFLLGVFTVIRLVDVLGEYTLYLARIARIRGYYRGLNPETAEYFGSEGAHSIPSLQHRASIASLTTSSAMVAFINNVVAGAGIALFARWLLGDDRTVVAVFLGIAGAVLLTFGFLAYQRWRFSMFEPLPRDG